MKRYVPQLVVALAAACMMIFASGASAENGALDAEFGVGGKVVLESPKRAFALAVAEHQGGLLLRIGQFAATGPLDVAVVRLNRDGAIDQTFGSNGALTNAEVGKLDDLAVAPDGRIAFVAGFGQLTVVQKNGSLDSTFGSGGRMDLRATFGGIRASAAEFQPDGKLVVVGQAAASPTLAAVRLHSDGSADTGFGNGGLVLSPSHKMPSSPTTPGLAISASGQILVGLGEIGRSLGMTRVDTGVLRLAANGSIDGTFGANGVAKIFEHWAAIMGGVSKIAPTSAGAIGVVQASSTFATCSRGCANTNYSKFLSSRGDLSQNTEISEALGVAATTNNQFVVTQGATRYGEMLISRVSAIGKLVRDFDSNGLATVAVGRYSSAADVAVQSDSKIVMAGSTCADKSGDCQVAVVRLLGERGRRAAPQPRIDSRIGTISQKRLLSVTGVASPSKGLRSVAVAIQLVKPSSGKVTGCNWLSRPSGDFRRRAKQKGKCLRPIFMRARGTKSWKFKLGKRLAPGRYRIFVRATTRKGAFNPLNNDRDSFREFRVVRR